MLSDTKIRNAKPRTGAYRLPDGGGLHLFITPAGGKIWRLRYRINGAEQTMVIGPYPHIGLAEARTKRDEAKGALVRGVNPKAVKADAAQSTLASVARRWHATNLERWNEHYRSFIWTSLENEILNLKLPGHILTLGETQIADIDGPMVLAALRIIEARAALEAAHRMRGRLEHIFAAGVGEGHCKDNPAVVIRRLMKPIVKRGHRPAVTNTAAAQQVLRKAEDMPAFPVTRLALRVLALTGLRPSEVCGGRWPELTGMESAEPVWVVPAERMKMKVEHWVPLSRQAVETIAVLRRAFGSRPVMFPSCTDQNSAMSISTLGEHLRLAGLRGQHVPHGWRATFSTIMNELYPQDRYVIDLMLAHKPTSAVEGAYNRANHLSRRRELAQIWADLLMDGMRKPSELLELPRK